MNSSMWVQRGCGVKLKQIKNKKTTVSQLNPPLLGRIQQQCLWHKIVHMPPTHPYLNSATPSPPPARSAQADYMTEDSMTPWGEPEHLFKNWTVTKTNKTTQQVTPRSMFLFLSTAWYTWCNWLHLQGCVFFFLFFFYLRTERGNCVLGVIPLRPHIPTFHSNRCRENMEVWYTQDSKRANLARSYHVRVFLMCKIYLWVLGRQWLCYISNDFFFFACCWCFSVFQSWCGRGLLALFRNRPEDTYSIS